jgi:hypothetical protein
MSFNAKSVAIECAERVCTIPGLQATEEQDPLTKDTAARWWGRENFEIGQILHLRSEIRNLKPDRSIRPYRQAG